MRFPVFSAPVNPAIDPPICRKSRSYVETLLATGDAKQLGKDLKDGVQLLSKLKPEAIESIGLSNLIPFARVQDPLRKPHTINYPIPAVGARNRPLWCHASILQLEARAEYRAAYEAMA